MPKTTFLDENRINKSTGDEHLDELLSEACEVTGEDYQVLYNPIYKENFLGFKKPEGFGYQLFMFVPGIAPWQELFGDASKETIEGYLRGVIDGSRIFNERLNEKDRFHDKPFQNKMCYHWYRMTGGRPMKLVGFGFTDVVNGSHVCYYVDKFGREWIADSGPWSLFRVRKSDNEEENQ